MIKKKAFGSIDGIEVSLFELGDPASEGLVLGLSDYGARITYLTFPDQNGKRDNIVCGFNNAEAYRNDKSYHGCIVGRVANRIKNSEFDLEGKRYPVTQNNAQHCLHGGLGFHTKVWSTEFAAEQVKFKYLSPNGEDGFPADLEVVVTYRLSNSDTLTVSFEASASAPTLCNLAQHAYFNLAGVGKGTIYDHNLQIQANYYTETDTDLNTTGKLISVEGSRFDFRSSARLGDAMKNGQLGFDDNFCLDLERTKSSSQVVLHEPISDRSLSISTTQPGVQLYTGNFLDGTSSGHGGVYSKHSALCLETQHYPGAERHTHFPSICLQPGQKYFQETVYRFGVCGR